MVIEKEIKKLLLTFIAAWAIVLYMNAQELNAKVNINHSKIQGTEASVFDELKEKLEEFINQQQWTSLKFQEKERINCSFNITLKEYKKESGTWGCSCMIQANRPVYNSSYNTTLFQFEDNDFTFTFNQFDKLEYNEEMIDNQLMALIAYYSYLIIGFDLDSFSPKGGEDVLQKCMNLTNNAQTLDYPGWNREPLTQVTVTSVMPLSRSILRAMSAPVMPVVVRMRPYLENLLWRTVWTMKLSTITRITINQIFIQLFRLGPGGPLQIS